MIKTHVCEGIYQQKLADYKRSMKDHTDVINKYLASFIEKVESGEVGLIALPPPARSNGSCSFPASRFPMWVALIGEGWVVFQGRGGSAARGRSLR